MHLKSFEYIESQQRGDASQAVGCGGATGRAFNVKVQMGSIRITMNPQMSKNRYCTMCGEVLSRHMNSTCPSGWLRCTYSKGEYVYLVVITYCKKTMTKNEYTPLVACFLPSIFVLRCVLSTSFMASQRRQVICVLPCAG